MPLRLTFRKYPVYTPITLHPTAPLYNIIIIILYDTILRQKRNFKHEKNEFNCAAIFPVWHELPMLRSGQINVVGIRRRQGT